METAAAKEKRLGIEIITHTFPRKSNEYSLWIVDLNSPSKYPQLGRKYDGVVCIHPMTSYKPVIDLLAELVQRTLDSDATAAARILAAADELP